LSGLAPEGFARDDPSRRATEERPEYRISVYGATDAVLRLLPALARRRDLELVAVYDPSARALRRRLALLEPGTARLLQSALCDDLDVFASAPGIGIAIDGGLQPGLRERLPAFAAGPGIELLSPSAASRRLGLAPAAWSEPQAPDARGTASPRPAGGAGFDDAIDAAVRARQPFVLFHCVAPVCADEAGSGAEARRSQIRHRIAERLRAFGTARDDLVGADDGSILALWMHAPDAPVERRLAQARAAAEAVAEALRSESPRPSLEFGFALHPEDGADRETLTRRAAAPRIRML
jgi:hypothetical protein